MKFVCSVVAVSGIFCVICHFCIGKSQSVFLAIVNLPLQSVRQQNCKNHDPEVLTKGYGRLPTAKSAGSWTVCLHEVVMPS